MISANEEESVRRTGSNLISWLSLAQVFFLTNGGTQIYGDARRNSLDEGIKLCLAYGLQGLVSEVKAIFMNPTAIARIKDSKLALLTYGQLKYAITGTQFL